MTEQNGLERSSATERLRAMLDERGVEWGAEESELDNVTTWNANGGQSMFYESKTTNPNLLQVNYYNLTPEQAVEATLGRGTCHDTQEDEERFCCSECGSRSHIATEYRKFDEYGNKSEHFLFVDNPRFCPSCGRKVVDA